MYGAPRVLQFHIKENPDTLVEGEAPIARGIRSHGRMARTRGKGEKKYNDTGFKKGVLGINDERYRYDRNDIIDIAAVSLPIFPCLVYVHRIHFTNLITA